MARSNGGIIGKSNKTSFGKNKITAVNATGCFTSQSGTTLVAAMLVGGGGGTQGVKNTPGSGAGGGGVVLHPGVAICAGTSYPIVIGGGGTGGSAAPSPVGIIGTQGCNTTGFGLTALGGGKSIFSQQPCASTCSSNPFSGSGGSGGGIMGGAPAATSTQGLSLQACQPGDSGTYGFGNRGGNVDDFAPGGFASGGGAGSAGTRGVAPPSTPDAGGNGLDITPFFGAAPQPFYTAAGFIAGGGGAGGNTYPCSPNSPTPSGGGGIGQGMASGAPRPGGGTDGTTNTGGGAGAVTSTDSIYPLAGSNGGSGQVLVKELNKASGVWSLQSQFSAQKQGSWPSNPVVAPFNINVLVVAGGGAGKYGQDGGGGAGGYRYNTSYAISPGNTFKVTVGGGGTTVTFPSGGSNTSGNPSSFNTCAVGCGATFASTGGGAGGAPLGQV
jgi:mucin-19